MQISSLNFDLEFFIEKNWIFYLCWTDYTDRFLIWNKLINRSIICRLAGYVRMYGVWSVGVSWMKSRMFIGRIPNWSFITWIFIRITNDIIFLIYFTTCIIKSYRSINTFQNQFHCAFIWKLTNHHPRTFLRSKVDQWIYSFRINLIACMCVVCCVMLINKLMESINSTSN